MFKKSWVLILLLVIPTFSLMLRHGIYTTHDFHPFRMFEFNKCIQEGTFPCRWAPDSEMGYGEPLFNFYAQLPYWLGEVFHFANFSILASVKIVFILSLALSGLTMYFLARTFWGNLGGVVSAALYVYAPYRSVDVWVRGALPEAVAFIFYPVVLLSLYQYNRSRKLTHLLLFIFSMAALITTHNLSIVMFVPLLALFWLYDAVTNHTWRSIPGLVLAVVAIFGLSAYYLLPVALEGKYIDLSRTTEGYYDFHIHFATLRELFISRFWGYGGSLWMRKFLSVSIGQVQWVVVALSGLFLLKLRPKNTSYFLVFSALGALALFLTHGKSALIWNSLPFMKYIQFPWRYLTSAIFFVALAGGFSVQFFSSKWAKIVAILLIIMVIEFNYAFFRPDIWENVSDQQFFSGSYWDNNRMAHKDYWPRTGGAPPEQFAPADPQFLQGTGLAVNSHQGAHVASYQFAVTSEQAQVQFPIVYFPGWQASEQRQRIVIAPAGRLGLITATLPAGKHAIDLKFANTWPRLLGNLISGLSFGILTLWFLKMRGWRWH